MTKKFEITDITHPDMPHLRRIRALRDIPTAGVKAGDLGGWVEKSYSLDQYGNAWVFDNAAVFGEAEVFGDEQVFGDAEREWRQ